MKLDRMDFYKSGALIAELDATSVGNMLISNVCDLLHENRPKSWWNSRASLPARCKLRLYFNELLRGLGSPWPEREAPIERVAKKHKAKASDMKNAASDDAFAKSGGE